MDAGELRKRLGQAVPGGRRGFDDSLRAAVVAYASARRLEGLSVTRVAAELGLPNQTLGRWLAGKAGRGAIRKVTVGSPPESAQPASDLVVECGPLRIRGLDLAGVVKLLRSLG